MCASNSELHASLEEELMTKGIIWRDLKHSLFSLHHWEHSDSLEWCQGLLLHLTSQAAKRPSPALRCVGTSVIPGQQMTGAGLSHTPMLNWSHLKMSPVLKVNNKSSVQFPGWGHLPQSEAMFYLEAFLGRRHLRTDVPACLTARHLGKGSPCNCRPVFRNCPSGGSKGQSMCVGHTLHFSPAPPAPGWTHFTRTTPFKSHRPGLHSEQGVSIEQ